MGNCSSLKAIVMIGVWLFAWLVVEDMRQRELDWFLEL